MRETFSLLPFSLPLPASPGGRLWRRVKLFATLPPRQLFSGPLVLASRPICPMEWYYILLVTLFTLGGVIAVTVVCLHIFECSYIYRHRHDTHLDSSDFSFDISQSASGQSTGAAREVSALPVNPGPEYMAARRSSVPSPTSPMSFLTFSDASSRSRTSLDDLNRELPVAPDRAHIKPPTTFLSFDKLRAKSSNDEEVDLEAQNEKVGQQMRNLGW